MCRSHCENVIYSIFMQIETELTHVQATKEEPSDRKCTTLDRTCRESNSRISNHALITCCCQAHHDSNMMKLADEMLGPSDKTNEHTMLFRQLGQKLSVTNLSGFKYVALLATPQSRLSKQEFSI